MAITDAFKNAVSAGDVIGIRIMMKDSMLFDPTFDGFNQMDTIAHGVKGLYEAHDGREMNNDDSGWDDSYMNKLMVQVVGNFSHERVDHLKNVVRKLRPVAVQTKKADAVKRPASRQTALSPAVRSGGSSYQEQKRRDEQGGKITTYRGAKIMRGAVAGGVAGGVVAGIAGASILAGTAAGAVVIGGIVAAATKGE